MSSELFIRNELSDRIIVAFGGMLPFEGKFIFEFNNFLESHFSDFNRLFYIDKNKMCYHRGIDGISNSIDSTIDYLREKINGYREVIFIGHSSGGYASILFGSVLNVNKIIAFLPQTILRCKKPVDEKYRDIVPLINDTTQYYLYSDPDEKIYMYHNIEHCTRIGIKSNVNVYSIPGLTVWKMKQDGSLLNIFNEKLR